MKDEQGAVDADDVGEGIHKERRRAQGVQQSPDLPENTFIAQSRTHDPRLRHLAGHGEKLAALERSELEGLRQPLQDLPVQPRLLAPLDLAHNARRQPCLFGQLLLAPAVTAGKVDLLPAQRGNDLAEGLVFHPFLPVACAPRPGRNTAKNGLAPGLLECPDPLFYIIHM